MRPPSIHKDTRRVSFRLVGFTGLQVKSKQNITNDLRVPAFLLLQRGEPAHRRQGFIRSSAHLHIQDGVG